MQFNVASTPHLRRIGSILTLGSVVAILFATLIPDSGQAVDSHLCLVCGSTGGVDSILNVILFIPLGIGLALSETPWKAAVLTACALSLTIETTQLFFVAGRDATLGDVLTNTVGGALGFAVTRKPWIWLRPSPRIATILGLSWCTVWLTIQSVSSFAFALSEPDSKYYGQIARELGGFAVFPGRVLDARIGDVAITDTELRNSDMVGRRLLGGAIVAVTVVPAGPTHDIAPILRIADDEEREIVLLGQDEQSLLFGVRTGAAILRLRPPLFAMRDAFAEGFAARRPSATGPLTLSARYDGSEAQLAAQAGSVSHHRRVSVSSSLGWTLALPFQWYIEDSRTERVMSAIWMACLMVPMGYWGAHVSRTLHRGARTMEVVLFLLGGVGILIAGLVLVRHAVRLPADPIRDWLAAIFGILAGGVLALRAGRLWCSGEDGNHPAARRNRWAVTFRRHERSILESREFPTGSGCRNLVNRTTRPLGGLSLNSTLR